MNRHFEDDKLYKPGDEALSALGTPGSLAVQRHKGSGPPYFKVGAKVLYSGADLNRWLAERRVEPVENHPRAPSDGPEA